MKACAKHTKEPVKGYCACPGCEVENLRSENAALRTELERVAMALNSLRAKVEGTLWPNSGFAEVKAKP